MTDVPRGDKNRVELTGKIASRLDRRRTPAGTPVVTFRLQVPPSTAEPALTGCMISVVGFGESVVPPSLEEGSEVEVEGALTERRWRGAGGVRQSRFEILARMVRVL